MADADRPWILRPASARAQREWDWAMRSAPDVMVAVRDRLRRDPLDRSDNPRRTHRLWAPLDTKRIGDRVLPQWQHEISAAGRVFYCADGAERVVWVTRVDLGHPRETS